MIAKLVGYSIFKLLKGELLFDFSTASSEAVLPRLMAKVEGIGVQKHNASFIIPTGYSFNLDGSTLYHTLAAIFSAQMYSIDRKIGE